MLQFIYELYDPRTDVVGYVGITTDPNGRYKQHLSMVDGNLAKNTWINDMLAEGVQPGMRIREIIENDDERAYQQERYWIQFYLDQGTNLKNIQFVNRTDDQSTESIYEGIQDDVPPLTDWQIKVWRTVYGDARDTGKKGQMARVTLGHLHSLFEMNNLLDNIQGEALDRQLAYLHAMLLVTPNVAFIKRSKRYLYQPEDRILMISAYDLCRVVFPPCQTF